MTATRSVAALVVGAALVLTGCGGPSATEYHAALDRQCAEAAAFNQNLPQRQSDEQLSSKQIERIAIAHAKAFNKRVRAIDAPGDLDDAQQKLVDLLDKALADPPTTVAAARGYLTRLVSAYDATGAGGCTTSAKASLKLFEQQQTPT